MYIWNVKVKGKIGILIFLYIYIYLDAIYESETQNLPEISLATAKNHAIGVI